MDEPLEIHHLENSRSHRVIWLAEEIGIGYRAIGYLRDTVTMQGPPALKELHPMGGAPVVRLDGNLLAESGAIIAVVLDRYGNGRLVPAQEPARAQYHYWFNFAEGSASTPLLLRAFLARDEGVGAASRQRAETLVSRVYDFVSKTLAGRPFFAGHEFSAADIMMEYPIRSALARGALTAGQLPPIEAYLERISARPAYARAKAKGQEAIERIRGANR